LHPGDPCLFAFDVLMCGGKDWRREGLTDRKQELRRLLSKVPVDSSLRYVDHVDRYGRALFQRVCKLDLEGIVAKQKSGLYVTAREDTTWFKIRNGEYSQMVAVKSYSSVTGTTNLLRVAILAF
jgi:ATP-dependent DNA ligase